MVNGLRIVILLFLCALWSGSAMALTVESIVGQDRIAAGESLQFQIRLNGSPDEDPDFAVLAEDWEIINRSQSSQMKIINSSINRSTIYSLTLMPRGEGQMTIPAVCFGTDCSQPITIEVSNKPRGGQSEPDQVLIETEVNSHQIMALGQLLLKVRLLLKVGLPVGRLSEPQPTGIDALVNTLGPEFRKHERRDGQVYQIIEHNYAIFPQESGVLQIPAIQYDGMVPGNRTRFDPFGRQGMLIRRSSQPLEIEVLPLPSDLGQRPWIPSTGVFLQDDWQQQPPQLVAGEPATRTLRLSAVGVLSAQLPELKPDAPAAFKVYFDQPNRKDQGDRDGATGILEQQITLIPTRPGHFQLPAIDLDWWDVTTNRWRTAHLDGLELDVAPAAEPVVATTQGTPPPAVKGMGSKEEAPAGADQTVPTTSTEQRAASAAGFWPWLSLGLALLWVTTLVMLFRKGRENRESLADKGKEAMPDEKAARRTAQQAARRNNPQATRQALVLWSRTLWTELSSGSYERLISDASPDFRKELETLDLHLYGDCPLPWDGQRLAVCIAEWRQVSTASDLSGLPDLYPGHPSGRH